MVLLLRSIQTIKATRRPGGLQLDANRGAKRQETCVFHWAGKMEEHNAGKGRVFFPYMVVGRSTDGFHLSGKRGSRYTVIAIQECGGRLLVSQ